MAKPRLWSSKPTGTDCPPLLGPVSKERGLGTELRVLPRTGTAQSTCSGMLQISFQPAGVYRCRCTSGVRVASTEEAEQQSGVSGEDFCCPNHSVLSGQGCYSSLAFF